MRLLQSAFGGTRAGAIALALAFGAVRATPGESAEGRLPGPKILHIGTSGSLTAMTDTPKEKGALESLKAFIHTETSMDNEIVRQKDWRELAEKMSKGELQIGIFQGFEFAWAREKYPELKPLALAVNVYQYPIAYVVTRADNKATNFAGLQGQSFCLPNTSQRYLKLFVDRQTEVSAGKRMGEYFSKSTTQDNVEDAIDDVVDGIVQATVVDRANLASYKRRKPGRFKQMKEVAHSPALPPVVVAYYGHKLDVATLKRFQDGLLRAGKSDRGQTILTMFRLTGFDAPPKDFAKVLAETRKTFPPENGAK